MQKSAGVTGRGVRGLGAGALMSFVGKVSANNLVFWSNLDGFSELKRWPVGCWLRFDGSVEGEIVCADERGM